MGVAARAFETGQFFFASSARRLKVASSMPGTLPSVARSMREIAQPASVLSKCTLALVRISCGLWPACESPLANAIEKHPACAAPINSSGLVPGPSSIRLLKEYAPSKAPLPSRIVPDPSCSERCQRASAVRTGISGHLTRNVAVLDLMLVDGSRGRREDLEGPPPPILALSLNPGHQQRDARR